MHDVVSFNHERDFTLLSKERRCGFLHYVDKPGQHTHHVEAATWRRSEERIGKPSGIGAEQNPSPPHPPPPPPLLLFYFSFPSFTKAPAGSCQMERRERRGQLPTLTFRHVMFRAARQEQSEA